MTRIRERHTYRKRYVCQLQNTRTRWCRRTCGVQFDMVPMCLEKTIQKNFYLLKNGFSILGQLPFNIYPPYTLENRMTIVKHDKNPNGSQIEILVEGLASLTRKSHLQIKLNASLCRSQDIPSIFSVAQKSTGFWLPILPLLYKLLKTLSNLTTSCGYRIRLCDGPL